jgi:hypothetical protein
LAGGGASGAFFNGMIESDPRTAAPRLAGKLTLDFLHYATRLEARWDGGALTGTPGVDRYFIRDDDVYERVLTLF